MADATIAQVIDTAAATRHGEGQFAVVFVHGFLDDRHAWDAVVSHLEAQGFESVQIDLAGSGARADADGPFDYDRFATDIGAVVDHIGKPFVMVGHSMGSAIAELVAAARPDRAMGLALLAPVPLAGVGMPAEAIASFRGLGGDEDGQRALRKQLSVGMSDPDLERIVAAGAQLRPDVVATLADCWNQGHPDGSGPSRYTGPGLVLTGADDPFVTADAVSAGVTPRLPQATTDVVDGAGHWPHMEQACAVAARIDEFLERTLAEFPAEAREQGWTQAFADKTEASFAEKFTEDVVLEASALNQAGRQKAGRAPRSTAPSASSPVPSGPAQRVPPDAVSSPPMLSPEVLLMGCGPMVTSGGVAAATGHDAGRRAVDPGVNADLDTRVPPLRRRRTCQETRLNRLSPP